MSYHIPVLRLESVEGLKIRPDGIYIDLTFGGGGHSMAILERLGENGRLVAFDQDMDAQKNVPDDHRISFVHSNFKHMRNFLDYYNIVAADGILADLGISSHQIDTSGRGFSYMSDSPLDMRMNTSSDITAADIINTWPEEELNRIFRDYGEIRNYRLLTAKILGIRQRKKILTAKELISGIESFLPKSNSYGVLSKIFQALRINVNDELGALREMLLQVPEYLKKGGRIVILTYHSLEDRMVKNFFKSGNFTGNIQKDFYGHPVVPFRLIDKKPVIPSEQEISQNSRSRSAKLRIAEKI